MLCFSCLRRRRCHLQFLRHGIVLRVSDNHSFSLILPTGIMAPDAAHGGEEPGRRNCDSS
jgi:hypothetical protein